jgi:hypothetical protein
MTPLLLVIAALVTGSAGPALVPPPPGELRGQVTRAGGEPVPRFTVNGVAFQDPTGSFRILTPPEGEFRVVVRADGFAPNVFHVQGASGKQLQIPEITLGAGEHVLGEVVDAQTDEPVPGALATLADPARLERLRFIRPERLAEVGTTGSGGWFELRRAPRGLAVLVVQHPEYLPAFVSVNTREPLPKVRLQRGATLSGTVRDARGAPVPGIQVVVLSTEANDGAEAAADARGRFEIRGLRPGRYGIAALPFGEAVDGGQIDLGDGQVGDVTIVLRRRVRQLDLPVLELGAVGLPANALATR